MNIPDLLAALALGLVVNEISAVSPWLARLLACWAARVRYRGDPVRAADRGREWVSVVAERPGKLLKLATAGGFAVAAVRYRAVRQGSAAVRQPVRSARQIGLITLLAATETLICCIVLPLVIVSVTARLGPIEVVQLALERGDVDTPGTYAYILTETHPQIAAFGAMLLLMLFLDFIFEPRDVYWLEPIERPLAKFGRLGNASVIISAIALLLTAELLAEAPVTILWAGILGMVTYLAVHGLGNLLERAEKREDVAGDEPGARSAAPTGPSKLVKAGGRAGFFLFLFLFLFLEVLNGWFTFDRGIGAVAIPSDPTVIALGLGLIGVILVRNGTLSEYIYLNHGTLWTIGAVAYLLLVSVGVHVPGVMTGLVGLAFIGAALLSSARRRKRNRTGGGNGTTQREPVIAGS